MKLFFKNQFAHCISQTSNSFLFYSLSLSLSLLFLCRLFSRKSFFFVLTCFHQSRSYCYVGWAQKFASSDDGWCRGRKRILISRDWAFVWAMCRICDPKLISDWSLMVRSDLGLLQRHSPYTCDVTWLAQILCTSQVILVLLVAVNGQTTDALALLANCFSILMLVVSWSFIS